VGATRKYANKYPQLEKKNNVNESAAFITSYHEPHIDAPVNPGFVKNESGGPYLLDSLDRQYMYNRKYSPQTLK